ncbi:twin-arginine translocase TatA/TatE family subunit [Candidatus Nitronereus thalassa]|uniref:Sec-independent protein translocase protein TatA n=1 Tax=Candidatus Nitronereus thalassa TaxID=3020898 RepID=A0ABU3KCA3_9BACT|nr:twin-arginine translocase TatA/TatE family subunit [Candidatus Nitronereus thalassa]MDT7044150.1 twin-arginine translocase TatA/TatE family subunit [Candidatus Nitronereus thalassa]
MFGSLGITELVLILIIVLIIFGAGKLPQLGEGVGKAIKGFKKSVHEADAIEAEAQAQAAEQTQAHPPMAGQGQAPDPNKVALQIAPASEKAAVPSEQVARPEPVQPSR